MKILITGANGMLAKSVRARLKEGKQKRWTIILAIVFAILSIALGILYMA